MRFIGIRSGLLLLAVTAVGAGCGGDRHEQEAGGDLEWTPENARNYAGVPAAEVRRALDQRVGSSSPPAEVTEHAWEDVQRLYARFGGLPLWLDGKGTNEARTKALLRAAVDAHTDAIHLDSLPLAPLIAALTALNDGKPTAEQAAEVDVLLSATYVTLAEFLIRGQVDPKELSQSWHVNPRRQRIDSAIVQSLQASKLDDAIARMRPTDPTYDELRRALAHYREAVATGGWPRVADGAALKRGDRAPVERLEALRQRLAREGMQIAEPEGQRPSTGVFHEGFAAAVAEFQERHGIAVDSALGRETINSLNVPAAFRLGQIAANLERYRWLPRHLGSKYIIVNVPSFRLEAWENGTKALEMRTVVGSEYEDRATPVFADSMEHVVFRPYWYVTPDIQRKEMEPKIASDPGYMSRGNYEYWQDGGQRRIRQRPGETNSLGLVKFMFPNSFNIYLHDTPQRELFQRDFRAFSHGCIRIEKPNEMAQWVLGWDAARVEQAMKGPREDQHVKLPEKIPVYIAYFTTYTRDDKLYFSSDLYNRDESLVQAVGGAAFPSPEAMRRLEELRKLAD
jgi:L,D-transpeptidase YcbB